MAFEAADADRPRLNHAIELGVAAVAHAQLSMRYYECVVVELPIAGFMKRPLASGARRSAEIR